MDNRQTTKSSQSTGSRVDTKDYWFLDNLLNELRVRLVKKRRSVSGSVIDTIFKKKLKQEDELHIYDGYMADLQTQQELTLEVKRWKARWELSPHFYCILKIYLTMPPSRATTELSAF